MLLDLLNHAHTTVAALASDPHHVTLAADPLPKIAPDSTAPGANAFTKVIGALMFYGLLGGIAGLIIGALAFGLGRWLGNHHAATSGRIGMLCSLAATLVVGGGSFLINWAFNLGASMT